MKTRSFTLQFKISLFVILLLILTAASFSALTLRAMNRQIMNEVVKRAQTVGRSIASSAAYSLLDGDILALDNLGWKMKQANGDIEYLAVTDTTMRVLAHSDLNRTGEVLLLPPAEFVQDTASGGRIYENRGGDHSFEVLQPIIFNGRQIGNVIVKINGSAGIRARSEALKQIVIGLFIIVLFGIGCVVLLSTLVTKPIKQLAKGVDDLAQGIQPRLEVTSSDELGRLTASFNHLSDLTTRQQDRLRTYAHQLEEAYVSTIKVLTAAIDARDPYTLGHSTRVAKMAIAIGDAIGLQQHELEDLEIASLFHDVGKLKTPDDVLLKSGPLDSMERKQIADHCEHGASLLSRASSLQKYIPAVRHHHEWFNGEGYPDGLRGDDIPLHAAIIAVADAFDAMTSVRPYKRSLSRDDAILELVRCSGSQFNPWLVDVFQTSLERDPLQAELFSGRGKHV